MSFFLSNLKNIQESTLEKLLQNVTKINTRDALKATIEKIKEIASIKGKAVPEIIKSYPDIQRAYLNWLVKNKKPEIKDGKLIMYDDLGMQIEILYKNGQEIDRVVVSNPVMNQEIEEALLNTSITKIYLITMLDINKFSFKDIKAKSSQLALKITNIYMNIFQSKNRYLDEYYISQIHSLNSAV